MNPFDHLAPILTVPLVSVPFGLLAAAAIKKWPHRDPLAPRIAPKTVVAEAKRHPALQALINSRLDPATETGLLLTASLVAIVGSLSAIGTLAEMIRTNRGLATYDLFFARWGADHATSLSTQALKFASLLGGYPGVTLAALVVAGLEQRRHMGRSVPALLVGVVGGQFAVTNAIKYIVDRARPNIGQLTGYSGSSFPSGHAAAAAASFAVFAFLLGRRRSVRVKALLGGSAVALAVAVAATRVLLGVHWFTDVLAGLFVGWAWFSLVSIAFGGRVLRFGDPLDVADSASSGAAHALDPSVTPVTIAGHISGSDQSGGDLETARLVLGPMLRYVGATVATIWVETDQPCTVSVLGVSTTTFQCSGHHYALVMLEDLEPGSVLPYTVSIDDNVIWPMKGSAFPDPVIRTLMPERPVTVRFGSCRMSAPHEPPYTLLPNEHPLGCGIDSLRTLGFDMLAQSPANWPDLLVFLGDQVYADESSPSTARRIEKRQKTNANDSRPPDGVVLDFEEYTWLYHEAWQPELERWVLSVVPTAMIFDDHDMIDDWNISIEWVRRIRSQPWWSEHVIGSLVSYWLYQHLGNLSPQQIRDEGMLAELMSQDDGADYLRRWALESESFTPVPGGYQFSFDRHIGNVHLVMIDCRNGRVLEPGHREMVDNREWEWICERVMEPAQHVILGVSLPVFAPGGLHGLQQWNEVVCDGGRGRILRKIGIMMRDSLDLEHWAAFDRTFRRIERLLVERATQHPENESPFSIAICGGDIHFSFAVDVKMPKSCTSTVFQAICSPIRNNLSLRDQRILRAAVTRPGRWAGQKLLESAGRRASILSWDMTREPIFGNNMGVLQYDGPNWRLAIQSPREKGNDYTLGTVLEIVSRADRSQNLVLDTPGS